MLILCRLWEGLRLTGTSRDVPEKVQSSRRGLRNERLIPARLQAKHGSITVVRFYAPVNDSSEDEKDQLYSSPKTVVEQVPTHDVLVVMGDFNAKIGNKNSGLERATGKEGCGKMNENEK